MLAVHAVVPRRTHPVPALRPAESGLTKAAAVDVEAARAVCTVAHTFTVLAVGTCRALLITPEGPNRRTHGGDPGHLQTKQVLHAQSVSEFDKSKIC